MSEPQLLKLRFPLVQDEDGYPPVAVESVWAEPVADRRYVIRNIPFFATQATLGDVVSAREVDGVLWFEQLQLASTSSLLRVVLFEPERGAEVIERLARLGCDVERLQNGTLVAVNVPASTSLATVRAYLAEHAALSWLDFEEAIVRSCD